MVNMKCSFCDNCFCVLLKNPTTEANMSWKKPSGHAQPHRALPTTAPTITNMATDAKGSAGKTNQSNDRFLCNMPKLHKTVVLGMAKHCKTGTRRGMRGTPKKAALNNTKNAS